MLGKREPEIYGSRSFEDYLEELRVRFPGEEIAFFQSNCEGEIIDKLQSAGFAPECRGIILNAGAYSHYSLAIADAIGAAPAPVVEVHISNIHSREEYRRKSVTAERAKAVIAGAGLEGYALAVTYLSGLKK